MNHITLVVERKRNVLEFSSKDSCKRAARDLKSQGRLFSEYHSGTLHQLTFLNEADARQAQEALNEQNETPTYST